MPLAEKRITLKGHLTRIEAYVERVTTEQQAVTEVDVQGNLTKLKDIEVQLQVVHESLIASKTAKENEAEEHALLQDRTKRLTSQLLQLLNQCEDLEEDEAKQEDPPVTSHEPHQGPSAILSIPESLTNKPIISTSNNVPWEPQAGPSRLHTPIAQTMQPDLISLGEVLNRLVEFQAGAEMRNTRLLDKLGEALLSGTQNQNHGLPRLPTLSLPEFSGEYTAWQHFKDMFTTMVDRDSRLSHVQKMQYLMMSVKGTAKRLIENLAVSADNYAVAWNVLLSYYEDQAAVVHHHVQRFCKMATVTNPTPASFMELYTTANSVLNSLDAMSVSSRDPWVIYLLLNKLDQETKVLWSRELTSNSPTIPEFMQFLKNRMKSIERCHTTVSKGNSAPTRPGSTGQFGTRGSNSTVMASTSANSTAQCHACGKTDHRIFKCPKFIAMPPKERLELIRKGKLCRKCLTATHMTKDCTFFACRKCAGHHSTLLHEAFVPPSSQAASSTVSTATVDQIMDEEDENPQDSQPEPNEEEQTAVVSSSTLAKPVKRIFLETVVVRILDKDGVPVQCRALLDSGAQVNLLSQSLAQQLNLPRFCASTVIGSVGEGSTRSKYEVECVVRSCITDDVNFTMRCQIVPSILQQKLPNWKVHVQEIPIPEGIALADPTWNVPQRIDLLIGNELYNDIYTSRVIRLGAGLPVMKESQFGWVVSGAHNHQFPTQEVVCMTTTLASIDSSLRRFWESEEIAVPPPKLPEQELVETIFQETTTRDHTGRYIVHIPFRPCVTRLHNNLPNATRQFINLEKRLSTRPEIRAQYHAAMQENLDLKFFEEVPPEDMSKPSYYMPHHGVVKVTPTGDKIRIVMNASSKSQTGLSLNDAVMLGPTVQPDIVTVLLRFREHLYAFSCDIQKMYPQVLIYREHRDRFRILWRSDDTEPIRHFRARGVCFGVTTSPYLATRVLIELARQAQEEFPLAAAALLRNFYVDDGLMSFPTKEEALECKRQLIALLGSAGMSLAKWCSNDMDLLEDVDGLGTQTILPESSKTLGMLWHRRVDTLSYAITKDFTTVSTKRELLSAIASLYDPLGMIGPVIVIGKLLLQETWKLKVGWDESLPEEVQAKWNRFATDLPNIQTLQIPRVLNGPVIPDSREVHVFCDSSSYAYGAVAYMVSISTSHGRTSRIIMAKSRIAPVKTLTILKLELCAAAMGARLLQKINEALSIQDGFLWTDSTIVLGQLRATRTKFDPFTSHRVSEIQRLTKVPNWLYVPSGLNPADIISRGLHPTELAKSEIWWSGPKFLTQGEESWPRDPVLLSNDVQVMVTAAEVVEDHPLESVLLRTNSYHKIRRIVAYINRFMTKASSRETGPLTSSEIEKAETQLIRMVQDQHFAEVRQTLQDGSFWRRGKFAHIRQLCPIVDQMGVIRVGGRLEHAPENYKAKHPVLLPKGRLSSLIAQQFHHENMHCGPQQLLSCMRQQFWPLSGRNLTRQVTRACVVCCKAKPITLNQQMGNLPTERVEYAPPFAACGIDFCGPVLTRPSFKRGGVSYKTYICVFVCFVTKAVHLEVVGNLTSEGFIAALRRFAARRSAPREIFCDNAKNFQGASNLLSTFLSELQSSAALTQECEAKGITWHFAPPRSPHHGGLYEAAVKIFKYHLVREIGQTILTFEELSTIAAQIEAIMNNRPITPLSEDPNEPTALTPNHFLIGKSMSPVPDRNLTSISPSALDRWQLCQKLLQHFAQRWRVEYLHTLQKRLKWNTEATNLKVGDLVLMCDDPALAYKWPMGIVQEIHPGRDGLCRVVTVRTSKGTYKRSVQTLSKLPIEGLSPSA